LHERAYGRLIIYVSVEAKARQTNKQEDFRGTCHLIRRSFFITGFYIKVNSGQFLQVADQHVGRLWLMRTADSFADFPFAPLFACI